ncbi:MAG: lytic transglycosylase domain-containing protein [Candidatus Acidiferrales bacterium]
MRTRAIASLAAILGLCLGLFLVRPAQAQIASYVDARGRTIYINANPPAQTARQRGTDGNAMAPSAKLQGVVNAAAARNNLDPALVQAVIQAESNWNPYAVSRKGAFGLMQLIPSTAERYGVGDVFDPVQNVNGGTRYLRDLLDRYHGDLKKSLAAYNAGEEAVQRYGGVPQYPETRAYVRKVTTTYFQSGSPRAPVVSASRQSPIREVTGRGGRTIFTNE